MVKSEYERQELYRKLTGKEKISAGKYDLLDALGASGWHAYQVQIVPGATPSRTEHHYFMRRRTQ